MKIDDAIEELQRIRAMRGNLPLVLETTDMHNQLDYQPVSIRDTKIRYPDSNNPVFVVLVS